MAPGLPSPATPLIGRDHAVREVRDLLLRPEVRLLTLVGAGGAGKTRLAIAAAAEAADTFVDGVVFVDLTTAFSAAEVVPILARSLGLQDLGSSVRLDRLTHFTADRQILLILDNFEHVRGAAPQIAELLPASPRLKVLVTSRVALRSQWERQFPVPPLEVPGDPSDASTARIAECASVALFVDRARSVRPDLALTDRNAESIAAICRRLDGLPLAIELAAARTSLLPPRALLTKLDSRLTTLTEGPLELPERQQTLRDAIAWSYDLLDPDQQAMFRRVAVFSGGFTEAQAEALWASPSSTDAQRQPRRGVLELLGSLVDNSLLRVTEQDDGDPRLTMLDTLREFAFEQLLAAGEFETMHQRHAELFLALAEHLESRLASASRTSALQRLEADYDNIRSALVWLLQGRSGELACRLAAALRWFWYFEGRITEGRRALEHGLELLDGAADATRIKALLSIGHLAWVQGDNELARRWLLEGVALARRTDDRAALADGLTHLSFVVAGQDEARRAEYEDEALAISRELGDDWWSGLALLGSGVIALGRGERETAQARLEESLALFERLGDAWFSAHALNGLGDAARSQFDYRQAADRYARSLVWLRQHDIRHSAASVQHNLAYTLHHAGDDAQALELFMAALGTFANQGDYRGIAECLLGLAACLLAQDRVEEAARLFGAAHGLLTSLGMHVWPTNTGELERTRTELLRRLDADASTALLAEGRAMRMDEAVRFARSVAASTPERAPSDPFGALTPREREIATLLARGYSNRQLAEALVISEQTAETHVKRVLSKLGLRSRHQVAEYVGSNIPTRNT